MQALALNKSLVRRFEELSVRMEVPDRNTVLLRSVPTNAAFFNQPATSLMVKRPRAGLAFVVSVDETLTYQGPNARLSSVFESGIRLHGWRTLLLALSPSLDLQGALDGALRCIGFDGAEPELPTALVGESSQQKQTSLLEQFGHDLTADAAAGELDPTIGREDEQIDALASVLSLSQTRLPLIVGPSGVGKTNLLHGIASRLLDLRPDRRLVAINLNQVFAGVTFEGEFENLCAALLDELADAPEIVLALEHAELLLAARVPRILAEALDAHRMSLLGTMLPEFANRIRPPLVRRTHVIRLRELSLRETREVLDSASPALSAHHGIDIDDSMLDACLAAARDLHGPNPAKSLAVLEAAASKAALTGSETLSPDDLHDAARRLSRNNSDEE